MRPIAPVMFMAIMLLAVPSVWAGPGEGNDRDVAREDARQAAAAFNLGHYDEAAVLYERAYKRVPDPILLYDLGQSYRLAHKPDEALIAYRSYLRTAPEDAPNRQRVGEMVDELERTAVQKRELALPQQSLKSDLTSPPQEHPLRKWAPWIGVGVTAALGVAAIAEGISADSTFNSLKNSCGKTKSCTDSQLSSDRSKATVTNVLWGLAAASAAATGVAFYFGYTGGREAGIALAWRY